MVVKLKPAEDHLLREIKLLVNGNAQTVTADERETLLDVLRNRLGLTSPRFGCGAEQCGTCSVLIDGEDKPSCAVEVGTLEGKSIVTIEGLGTPAKPHPLQTAFLEKQAGQCGYCLSGILVASIALLDRNPSPTRAEIAEALAWHLCRCGAHNRILDAVALAASRLKVPA
jgi:nicotinate dehydrogenase subunit A